MAELVDAADSKSVALIRRVGSIPSPGTIYQPMNFCSNCGNRVVLKVPEGELLPRHVCPSCGTIHYLNPKIVVGSVPEYQGRILICKRGIEPRLGYWTIPAGFMENDETMEVGAAREAVEEALIQVEIGSLLLLANVTSARQVHVFFRSRMLTPTSGSRTRAWRSSSSTNARSPGTTWRSRAPNTHCGASSRIAPPASSVTTWPKCSAVSRQARFGQDSVPAGISDESRN